MNMIQNSMFDKKIYTAPLADRMRPKSLDEFVGQEEIVGKGKILRELIESDNVPSIILWGPPGVGKTTLAMIIANMTNANFITFSAVTSGIKEIKDVMAKAEDSFMHGMRTVLFIDEIHRFNKAQQDAFLPYVERGNITLIGATTENPSFEINAALISRCRVFVLKSLDTNALVHLLKSALKDNRGYGNKKIEIDNEFLETIAQYSNGDARSALNTLEMAVSSSKVEEGKIIISKETVEGCMQKKSLLYDKNGEEHYNLISALHKSMRNSDPDAAVYWLARMLEAGEDPLYIARRMIQFSSEDVGLADPRALEIAVAAYTASRYLGMPECYINLAEAAVYLAAAPKSNAIYTGYMKAKEDALKTLAQGVPMNLRNAPTRLMKDLGYHKGYEYAHDYKEKVTGMQCLPENLKDKIYYNPTEEGEEKSIKKRVETVRNLKYKMRNNKS